MNNYFNKNDENLIWKTGESKILLKTIVCDITSQHNISQNGFEGDFIIMNAPDWVIVIPERDENFLMVKQWRHGEKSLSVEFPGGVIEKNEKPETAALRELKEETGFVSKKLIKLGITNPNPALFSNHVHIYLAEDLISTGIQHLDQDEFINFIEIPKNDVLQGMGTAEFPHALMSTALYFYLKYKKL